MSNFIDNIKSIKGFSLIEIMVLAGLVGGIGLVAMNTTKNSSKSSVKLEFDSDVALITSEIGGILSDPAACLATFGGNKTSPTDINIKYPINTPIGNSGLKIASYNLSSLSGAPNGTLTVNYAKKNILKGNSGAANLSKKIPIYFEGPLTNIFIVFEILADPTVPFKIFFLA